MRLVVRPRKPSPSQLKERMTRSKGRSGPYARRSRISRKKEARIAALQAELVEDEEGIARHRQRLQAAREYREHLATQKLVEVSERTLQHLKTLAAAVSPQDPQQAQAQAWALRAVRLGTWKEEVDMAGGAAEAGSECAASERTRLDLSRDETRADAVEADEELLQNLSEAQRRLEAVQREQSDALSRVAGPLGGDNKRDRAGECKSGDRDGDVDMVPPLTGLQVAAMFAERIREAEEQVRHYQILLSREEVLPPMSSGATATRTVVQQPLVQASAESHQAAERRRTEGQGSGEGNLDEVGLRGRPRRRPGHESWVTAEERDEAMAGTQRLQQQQGEGRQQLPQKPRTASREEGPGRCRWAVGAGRTAAGRQRSAGPRTSGTEGWDEVEREFRKQQRAGEDLESRVRDNLQVAEQERTQQLQEAERREMAVARAAAAAREVEARLVGALGDAAPRGTPAPSAAGEADGQVVPTFGPTGQRLDEQQHLLRVAAAGAAAERAGAVGRPPSAPMRRPRWGDDSGAEEEGARERSQRGARGPRVARGAMEN